MNSLAHLTDVFMACRLPQVSGSTHAKLPLNMVSGLGTTSSSLPGDPA
jgi:hypothetical protein